MWDEKRVNFVFPRCQNDEIPMRRISMTRRQGIRWMVLTVITFCVIWGITPTDAEETKTTLEQFLAEKRNATMATIRANGTSQLTPVWFYWNGEQFYISITTERAKYHNLVRDPRMSL